MRLIVVSDIHGYYNIFKNKLKEVNFRENSKEDLLICCGDYWDRGNQPFEVMTYLMSLDNVVLVKGNHEDLMEDYIKRGYAESFDIHNGTDKTFWNLCGKFKHNGKKALLPQFEKLIKPFYDRMVDYYETEHYVFVHGWIPLHSKYHLSYGIPLLIDRVYDSDWRDAVEEEWKEARWLNGIDEAFRGNIIPDKIIVCGHWHCSAGWYKKSLMDSTGEKIKYSEFGEDACWEPFKYNGIIAIDRCTAHTGDMNVLILEDSLNI